MSLELKIKEAGGSLDDHLERIRMAWRKEHDTGVDVYSYIADVFLEYVIVKTGDYSSADQKCYQVPYTYTDDAVTFAAMSEWVEVKLEYVAATTASEESAVTESFRALIEAVEGKDPEAVIVTEGLSMNGNHYTSQALHSGVEVFKGALMFADHPTLTEEAQRPERSVRDLVGRLGEAYISTDKNGKPALRAPMKISETANWLKTMVKEGIVDGLSIRASGKGKRNSDGHFVVEAFVANPATSVDFVTLASAGGYPELSESQRTSVLQAVTADAIRQHRPELVEELQEAGTEEIKLLKESGMKPEEIKALQESNQKLLEENARLFREKRTTEAAGILDKLLVEALPDATKDKLREQTKVVIETFASHGSEQTPEQLQEALSKLVEAEKAYIAKILPNGVVSGLGKENTPIEPTPDTALEEAFKGMLPDDAAKIAAQGRDR